MEGYIDFHAHILPQMDDGSDGVETSLALLQELAGQGVSLACATSHFYGEQQPIAAFVQRREAAWKRLEQEWKPGLPKILLGAEVAFFKGIGDCPELNALCLQGTRTLLLEMPFSVWCPWEVDEVLRLVLDRGYRVVLAHPERYCFDRANRRNLEKLAQLPLGFQVNAQTFLHLKTRKTGLWLLELTQTPVLGTDCHNLTSRPPRIAQARDVIRRKLGNAFLEEMDCTVQSLLSDEILNI